MARPIKRGLEWFRLEVNFWEDDKVELIEAKHGIVGSAILLRLLSQIYRDSYFYRWTEREQILFAKRANVDLATVKAVVTDALEDGFFDKPSFEKFQILTSRGIQERYRAAVEKREGCEIAEDHDLITPRKATTSLIASTGNPASATVSATETTPEPEFPQKKLHRSDQIRSDTEESTLEVYPPQNNSHSPPPDPDPPPALHPSPLAPKHLTRYKQELKPMPVPGSKVFLTDAQWATLCKTLGEKCAEYLCRELHGYSENMPKEFKKYCSHYRTILVWHKRHSQAGRAFSVHPDNGVGFYYEQKGAPRL